MHKKILAICAALVAFAIVPAVASASPVLTENGTALAASVKITALSTKTENAVFAAGSTEVKCNENWMTGTVHRNKENIVEGTIEKAEFRSNLTTSGTDCDGGSLLGPTVVEIPDLTNFGGTGEKAHWCIKTVPKTDEWELEGRSCTSTVAPTLTFILRSTGGLKCAYIRTATVRGTFTTNSTPVTLKVTGEPEFTGAGEGNSFLCPGAGKIRSMDFDLYTDTATEAESEKDGLTIS